MKLNGIEYPVIGMVRSEFLRKEVPLLDIPMMSGKRWNELAKEQNEKKKSPQIIQRVDKSKAFQTIIVPRQDIL